MTSWPPESKRGARKYPGLGLLQGLEALVRAFVTGQGAVYSHISNQMIPDVYLSGTVNQEPRSHHCGRCDVTNGSSPQFPSCPLQQRITRSAGMPLEIVCLGSVWSAYLLTYQGIRMEYISIEYSIIHACKYVHIDCFHAAGRRGKR